MQQMKSLGSALRLLGFFTTSSQQWKVSELARAAGMHKSQVSRILKTFAWHGFVSRDGNTDGYQIGWAFEKYAALIKKDEHLLKIARPVMEDVNRETRGTILLKVRDHGETVTIHKVESQFFLRLGYPLGHRLPLNVSSSGKVFLANMPSDEVERLSREGMFQKSTRRTKTRLNLLQKDLALIRRRGFAFSDEEHLLGARAVAAPIFGPDGNVLASIGVGLPKVMFPRSTEGKLGAIVRKAGGEISRKLGYEPTKIRE